MSISNISIIHSINTKNSSNTASTTSLDVGFWEIGAYKANVQRIRNGAEQLEELIKMIKERIQIESKYGKSLQNFYQKWSGYSERHIPDGSVKIALDGILTESKELARVHLAAKDRFNDEVVKTIGLFKKDNYHHSALRGFSEPKEIEDEFEKAQRQWKKLYERVTNAKQNFHNCCRAERSACNQMTNSNSDSSFSQDGAEKARERYEKCRKSMEKARTSYEQHLREISHFNSVYMENMAFVFEKCQQMELKRMKFLVEMLNGMQKILEDLVTAPKLNQVHRNLMNTFNTLGDHQLTIDLEKWSLLHGTNAPVKWPTFEPYKQEFRNISTMGKCKGESGVILTKKILKSEDGDVIMERSPASYEDDFENSYLEQEKSISRAHRPHLHNYEFSESENSIKDENQRNINVTKASSNWSTEPPPSNKWPPFEDYKPEFSTISSTGLQNIENKMILTNKKQSKLENGNGDVFKGPEAPASAVLQQQQHQQNDTMPKDERTRPTEKNKCVLVQALHDYEPTENDELLLVKGEIFEFLSGPDKLGWCRGKKDDRVGFFPNGYVNKI